MALVLPTKGQSDWDVTLNTALQELDSNITANSSKVNGVTVTNDAVVDFVLKATSPTEAEWAVESASSGTLIAANNLSDLNNVATARTNLGLGSAATASTASFDAAGSASTAQTNAASYTNAQLSAEVTRADGAYLSKANNLSDLANITTAKTNLSLQNVNNTSDASKPISTATQAALDLKAPLASPTFTGTVSGVTASMVGLGNVTNTSDTAKPVSTAQQAALDLKANIASPTFTGTVGGITSAMVGLGNVTNTSDANKPVSTAQQTALNAKLTAASNLSDVTVVATARTNLGLGGAAVLNVGTSTGTVAAGDDSRITGAAQKASNLSDLASVSTARTNLGLGGAALLNIGTTTGTAAAGDDSRIVGAIQPNTSAVLTNLDVTANLAGIAQPRNHGLVAWTTDPTSIAAGSTMTLGTPYLLAVYVPRSTNVSTIYWGFTTTAVVTPTTAQNFVGLYNSAGTRLATTDVTSVAAATGVNATTIATTAVTPGMYWIGLVFNGTTAGTAYRASSLTSSIVNIGLTASTMRFATNGTAQTSLPATITPASNVGIPTAFFAALG